MSFEKSTTREYFESVVIAVILALFVRTWVVQAFKIPTGSMEQKPADRRPPAGEQVRVRAGGDCGRAHAAADWGV